jgi:hypothetical protein
MPRSNHFKNDNTDGRNSENGRIVTKRDCEAIQIKGTIKNGVFTITRFLSRSRNTVLLIVTVVLLTLIFSLLIVSWFSNSDSAPNGDYDRTVPTIGTISVQNLEIYGGDIKTEGDKVYVDWGELTLGASKKVSFYVKSTSNVDVELGLNVTNWAPAGIEDYIPISWNYNGTLLSPTQEILVTVNLQVPSNDHFMDFLVENAVTTFGFDITIYASGVQ